MRWDENDKMYNVLSWSTGEENNMSGDVIKLYQYCNMIMTVFLFDFFVNFVSWVSYPTLDKILFQAI